MADVGDPSIIGKEMVERCFVFSAQDRGLGSGPIETSAILCSPKKCRIVGPCNVSRNITACLKKSLMLGVVGVFVEPVSSRANSVAVESCHGAPKSRPAIY